MDLVVMPPPWIPEDDLLLKNSVEAGASLESLAKGAVRFSRKYSIKELRNRWQSLLYDPDVAAEASASMANLELSGKSAGSVVKEGGTGTGTGGGEGVAPAADVKRKRGPSIRNQYYAMRKRLCRQVHDSSHMVSCDEMSADNKAVNHVIATADNSVDKGRGLKGKCARDDVLNNNASSAAAAVLPGNDVVSRLSRLSDSLLNLANGDELLFMDVDGKGDDDSVGDKPCYENVDSLLLSSPCEVQGNEDASGIFKSRKLDRGTKASSPCHLHSDSDPGNNAKLSVSTQSPRRESNAECMICLVSTEDPDVPSNDSADFSVVVPPLLTMKSQPVVQGEVNSDSSINNQRKKEPGGRSKKEDNPSQSTASSQPQLVRPGLVPNNVNSSHSPVGVAVKGENAGRNSISPVSKQTNNVKAHPNDSIVVQATNTMVPAADGHRKQKEIDAPASAKVCANPRVEELNKHLLESEKKSLSLNQEGGGAGGDDYDNDDDDDYGNDLPSFSDAEAMILEMDLCPADEDTHASREVLRYQHDETKRTIMRLEQCAQSFMQRAIASRGAFAVLYGRNLKQYINKSEVILGRGTDDFQVDIDLRKEGCVNKISRRQALIKMEADGSFIIKNLGKSSIFLNGKEIATGQLRGLSANCLIEIRGLSFIFETNDKSVRSFLEIMDNKEEDKRKACTMVG